MVDRNLTEIFKFLIFYLYVREFTIYCAYIRQQKIK